MIVYAVCLLVCFLSTSGESFRQIFRSDNEPVGHLVPGFVLSIASGTFVFYMSIGGFLYPFGNNKPGTGLLLNAADWTRKNGKIASWSDPSVVDVDESENEEKKKLV